MGNAPTFQSRGDPGCGGHAMMMTNRNQVHTRALVMSRRSAPTWAVTISQEAITRDGLDEGKMLTPGPQRCRKPSPRLQSLAKRPRLVEVSRLPTAAAQQQASQAWRCLGAGRVGRGLKPRACRALEHTRTTSLLTTANRAALPTQSRSPAVAQDQRKRCFEGIQHFAEVRSITCSLAKERRRGGPVRAENDG